MHVQNINIILYTAENLGENVVSFLENICFISQK